MKIRQLISRSAAALSVPLFLGMLGGTADAASPVSPVVTFDASRGENPESIAIDKRGNIYVSMLPTGEIRKIAPDGTQSTLAVLGVGPIPRFLLGLAVDAPGNVYALLNDVPATRGVWRISPDGAATRIAPLPSAAQLNALAFDHRGNLYITDSIPGTIYRLAPDGSVVNWLTDPLLKASPPLRPVSTRSSGRQRPGVQQKRRSLRVEHHSGRSRPHPGSSQWKPWCASVFCRPELWFTGLGRTGLR